MRLLARARTASGSRVLARMRVPPPPDVAGLDNSGYIHPTCILEGMGQAAFLLALKSSPPSRVSDCFAVASLALFCFTRSCAPGELLDLDVRLDPSDAQGLCFNAEARDENARIVACAHSLRFAAKRF
jgi:3-hydroxymyristoyl/3-hydroxydecanoyl-(acyl carrier protein) dehydratase